jgi:hypothetical protein
MRERSFYPQANRSLAEAPSTAAAHTLRYVPTTGIEAGGPVMWFGDVAPDQRPTDAFSLVYDSEPLAADLEILGLPRARLQASADQPLAHWFARLSDVAPDGTVTLVAGAGFNGAHRESARDPRPLEPGRQVALDIEMHFTSWVFPKGHRLRFAVSNAQWPMIWPTPHAVTTTLHLGGATPTMLVLPVIPAADRPVPRFEPPSDEQETLPGFESVETGTTSGYGEISSIERDPQRHLTRVTATNDSTSRYPWGDERVTERITHEANDLAPEKASVRGQYSITVTLRDRTLRWECDVGLASDRESFHYSNTRRLFVNETLVREKSWNDVIPRDHQ